MSTEKQLYIVIEITYAPIGLPEFSTNEFHFVTQQEFYDIGRSLDSNFKTTNYTLKIIAEFDNRTDAQRRCFALNMKSKMPSNLESEK